jgi:hypothetical protein
MKIIECIQGSQAWIDARLGIPTSSCFDQIVTPKTLKPSASQLGYIAQLLAESALGISLDAGVSDFMERGTELETRARAFYEFDRGVTIRQVGFIRHDTLATGCSPDGLADGRGVEIKCPGAKQHILNLLTSLADRHQSQVQGSMWITGLAEWDLESYHPELPPLIVTVKRDAAFMAAFDNEIPAFLERLNFERARLSEMLGAPLPELVTI